MITYMRACLLNGWKNLKLAVGCGVDLAQKLDQADENRRNEPKSKTRTHRSMLHWC